MKITEEMVDIAWRVFLNEYLTNCNGAMRSALEAALAAAPTPKTTCLFPLIDAQFETVEKGITGTISAPIKRVEMRDNESYTVIIDHWPAPTPPAQEDKPVAYMDVHDNWDLYKNKPEQIDIIPLYTRPQDDKLRKEAEKVVAICNREYDSILDFQYELIPAIETLRAALEGK